jgi:hypothetical protein
MAVFILLSMACLPGYHSDRIEDYTIVPIDPLPYFWPCPNIAFTIATSISFAGVHLY